MKNNRFLCRPFGSRNFSEARETFSNMMQQRPEALTEAMNDPGDEADMDWEDPDARIFDTVETFRWELSHRPSSPFECSEQTRSRRNLDMSGRPRERIRRVADARHDTGAGNIAGVEPGSVRKVIDFYNEASTTASVMVVEQHEISTDAPSASSRQSSNAPSTTVCDAPIDVERMP